MAMTGDGVRGRAEYRLGAGSGSECGGRAGKRNVIDSAASTTANRRPLEMVQGVGFERGGDRPFTLLQSGARVIQRLTAKRVVEELCELCRLKELMPSAPAPALQRGPLLSRPQCMVPPPSTTVPRERHPWKPRRPAIVVTG
jgi:hypothetical protein